jgi:succinate dehydrogenase / fumarate reductase cytochrome b subunit
MFMSGLIVFVFIVYHILHFTVEVNYLNFTGQSFAGFIDPAQRHDIFKMMVVGFSNIWVSGFYILGMALLCLHLSHGASSMFQSMGWKKGYYKPLLDNGAKLIAILIFAGYAIIPISILLGYGKSYLDTPAKNAPTELVPAGGAK